MCQGQHPEVASRPYTQHTPLTPEVGRTSVMEGELAMVKASSAIHKHIHKCDGHKVHTLYPSNQHR